MNACASLITMVLLAAAASSWAPQDGRGQVLRPAFEAEKAQPAPRGQLSAGTAQATDSVADDLQKIVVLCATKPASAEFDRAWSSYVRQHVGKGDDVDALIEEVMKRAAAWQSDNGASKKARARVSGGLSPQTRKSMHDSAKAMIGNVRG